MSKPETGANSEQQDQHPARGSSFSRGVFFTGMGTAVNIVFLFLETMIAARLLAPEDYGVYVILIAVVNFLVMTIDWGQRISVTQLIASSDPARQQVVVSIAWGFRLLVVVLVSGLILLAQPLVHWIDSTEQVAQYMLLIPPMLAVASFDELFLGMLQGFQAYRRMAIGQVIRSVLRLGLTVVLLVVFNLGIMGLIYSWIISFTVSTLFQFLVLPISRRFVYQRPLLGEMLRFGFPLQLSRFLWFGFSQMHELFLGTLAGPTSVAFYAVAARIPQALQRLSESYIAVYFPTTAALLSRGEHRQAQRVLDRTLRLISFSAALVVLVGVVFSREIMTLLFSEQYADSSMAFALLMIGFHVTFVLSILGYTLTAAGYPGRSLGENLFRTTLTIVGDLLLIPGFGFMGPVYASLGAAYASNPVAIWLLRRSGIVVVLAPYVKQTTLLLVGAALHWWILPAGLAYKLATVVAFALINVALSSVSREDLDLVLPQIASKRLGTLIRGTTMKL
jgi:O-antigen/teichoic acid export membrane protein